MSEDELRTSQSHECSVFVFFFARYTNIHRRAYSGRRTTFSYRSSVLIVLPCDTTEKKRNPVSGRHVMYAPVESRSHLAHLPGPDVSMTVATHSIIRIPCRAGRLIRCRRKSCNRFVRSHPVLRTPSTLRHAVAGRRRCGLGSTDSNGSTQYSMQTIG